MAEKKFRRNTQQRQVILDELRLLKSHPTASELYEVVRRKLPKISLGTVYRNLDLLSQLGMVQKLDFAGAETRFDGETADHNHVRCTECGRLDDVWESPGVNLAEPVADLNGFQITGHRLEFLGVCPPCQTAPGSPGGETNPDPPGH